MTIQIKHTDGRTNVIAKVFVTPTEITADYRYQGMSYGVTLTEDQAIKFKIIKAKKL